MFEIISATIGGISWILLVAALGLIGIDWIQKIISERAAHSPEDIENAATTCDR